MCGNWPIYCKNVTSYLSLHLLNIWYTGLPHSLHRDFSITGLCASDLNCLFSLNIRSILQHCNTNHSVLSTGNTLHMVFLHGIYGCLGLHGRISLLGKKKKSSINVYIISTQKGLTEFNFAVSLYVQYSVRYFLDKPF